MKGSKNCETYDKYPPSTHPTPRRTCLVTRGVANPETRKVGAKGNDSEREDETKTERI